MSQILLVSHGTMAEGIYKAANMFTTEMHQVKYLCLPAGKSIVEYKKELSETLRSYDNNRTLVIMADIKGGSPYNSSVELVNELGMMERTYIIPGMNLPLVMQIVMGGEDVSEDEINRCIQEAQDGMELFKLVIVEDDEEDL